ncbi:hypothetical protein WGM54_26385 [Paenibacillus polymyxa]
MKTVLSLLSMTMFELVETGISYHKRSYGGTIVGVAATLILGSVLWSRL